MELSKFTDGIKLQNERIDHAIRSEGVSVIHERSYSYTVGMRSIGYPELLVRDLKPEESNELFSTIYAAVTNGKKNSHEISIADIFKPKLALVDLTEDTTKKIFYACRAYYGDWIFRANEILIQ